MFVFNDYFSLVHFLWKASGGMIIRIKEKETDRIRVISKIQREDGSKSSFGKRLPIPSESFYADQSYSPASIFGRRKKRMDRINNTDEYYLTL